MQSPRSFPTIFSKLSPIIEDSDRLKNPWSPISALSCSSFSESVYSEEDLQLHLIDRASGVFIDKVCKVRILIRPCPSRRLTVLVGNRQLRVPFLSRTSNSMTWMLRIDCLRIKNACWWTQSMSTWTISSDLVDPFLR